MAKSEIWKVNRPVPEYGSTSVYWTVNEEASREKTARGAPLKSRSVQNGAIRSGGASRPGSGRLTYDGCVSSKLRKPLVHTRTALKECP